MAEGYQMQEQAQDPTEDVDPTCTAVLTFTGSQERQTKGRYPSIAVNGNGKLVELHQPSSWLWWSNTLYYQVGTLLEDCTVRWSQEEKGLSNYDGKFARVALDSNNNVVIVYELGRYIYYHVGSLDTKRDKIEWADHSTLSWGRYPAVALNDRGQVVIAYEQAIAGYATYYHTGQFQHDNTTVTINWSESKRLFTHGTNELSLAVNQTDCIVAVGRGARDKIYFRVGTIFMPPTDNDQKQECQKHFDINWGVVENVITPVPKCRPCVSINDAGIVTVVYQAQRWRQMSYHVGKIDVKTKTINWLHEQRNYDMGCNPTVALCNNGTWIEEHETNSAHYGHKLFYRVGKIHGNNVLEAQSRQESEDKNMI